MKLDQLNFRNDCAMDNDDLLRLKVMSKIDELPHLTHEQREARYCRANRELLAIRRQGRAAQFLAAAHLVNMLRKQYIVSPAAGVMASSYVNRALGITEIDPLEHGLLFERFISDDDEWFTGLCIEAESLAIHRAHKFLQENYGTTFDIEFQPIQPKDEIQDTLKNYFEELKSISPNCNRLEYQEDAMKLMQTQLYYSPAESNRQRILLGKCEGDAMENLRKRIELIQCVNNAEETTIFRDLYSYATCRLSKAWIVSRQTLLNRLNNP